MANQPTGRSLLRQLDRRRTAGAPNEGLVALQTAELLRTTLLSRSDVPPAPRRATRRRRANAPAIAKHRRAAPPPAVGRVASRHRRAVQPRQPAIHDAGLGDRQPRRRPAVRHRAGRQRAVARQHDHGPGRFGRAFARGWSARASFVRYERPGSRLYGIAAAGGAVDSPQRDRDRHAPLLASSGSTTAGAIYVRADGGFEATRWLRLGAARGRGVVPPGCPGAVRGQRGRRVGSSVPGGDAASSTCRGSAALTVRSGRRRSRCRTGLLGPDHDGHELIGTQRDLRLACPLCFRSSNLTTQRVQVRVSGMSSLTRVVVAAERCRRRQPRDVSRGHHADRHLQRRHGFDARRDPERKTACRRGRRRASAWAKGSIKTAFQLAGVIRDCGRR